MTKYLSALKLLITAYDKLFSMIWQSKLRHWRQKRYGAREKCFLSLKIGFKKA